MFRIWSYIITTVVFHNTALGEEHKGCHVSLPPLLNKTEDAPIQGLLDRFTVNKGGKRKNRKINLCFLLYSPKVLYICTRYCMLMDWNKEHCLSFRVHSILWEGWVLAGRALHNGKASHDALSIGWWNLGNFICLPKTMRSRMPRVCWIRISRCVLEG